MEGDIIGSIGQVIEQVDQLSFFMFPKLAFVGLGMEGKGNFYPSLGFYCWLISETTDTLFFSFFIKEF